MRKNGAFVAKIVITHLTKKFIAIFALAERLPTSATLHGHNHGKGEVDGDSHSNGDGKSNIHYDDDMMLEELLTKLFQESGALTSSGWRCQRALFNLVFKRSDLVFKRGDVQI